MYFEQLIPMFIEVVYIHETGICIFYLLCKWMPLALHNVFGTYHIGQSLKVFHTVLSNEITILKTFYSKSCENI